jgi:Flp pilus assembly protein TadG
VTGRRAERGQGLVEFAIVIPVIALFMFGLLDLGRAVFTYNTVAQAARQAARMAIVDQTVDNIKSTAISAAPTVGMTSSDVAVCFKTATTTQQNCSSSTDDCPSSDRVIGCLAIVVVSVSYQPMTPIVSTLFSSIGFSSTSIEPIEYVCPYGTHTTCP